MKKNTKQEGESNIKVLISFLTMFIAGVIVEITYDPSHSELLIINLLTFFISLYLSDRKEEFSDIEKER